MIEVKGRKLCECCFHEISSEPCSVCHYKRTAYQRDHSVLSMGSKLGSERYIVGGVIGQGGFGITYLAYDTVLDRQVAIKEYFPKQQSYRQNDSLVPTSAKTAGEFEHGKERFTEEAKMLAGFNNPNIVSVFDFFSQNGTAYFAMGYLSGDTLDGYLEKKKQPVTEGQAVRLLLDVSNALTTPHAQHIFHRDIKPDNIMLCTDNSVRVFDFGAARQILAEQTQKASVVFTPGFAPIEQYTQDEQGAWTDIYSLGATVYMALALKKLDPPFSRKDNDEEFVELKGKISDGLFAIIQKCTKVKAEERYQNVEDLIADVQKLEVAPESFLDVVEGIKIISGTPGPDPKPPPNIIEKLKTLFALRSAASGKFKFRGIAVAAVIIVAIVFGWIVWNQSNSSIDDNDVIADQMDSTQSESEEAVVEDEQSEENAEGTDTDSAEEEEDTETVETVGEGSRIKADNVRVVYNETDLDQRCKQAAEYPVFGSEYTREQISAISVVAGIEDADDAEQKWDISKQKDGSAFAWVKKEENGLHLYIGGENGIRAPQDCGHLFAGYKNVESIEFSDAFQMDEAEDMTGMFLSCRNLKSIDIHGWNTSHVSTMKYLFSDCKRLESVNLEGFDTSYVEDMMCMFEHTALEEIDVSGFDTSRATNMGYMFCDIANLTELDISNFDTSNVEWMYCMFSGNKRLKHVSLGEFDTSASSNMSYLFNNCEHLEEVDVSGFDTSKVEFMQAMFSGCKLLKELDVSGFDTSKVKRMDYMFSVCEQVTELDVSGFDTSKVENMECMFNRCKSLEEIDVSGFDTSSSTNMSYLFGDCEQIKKLDVSGFSTSRVENMYGMFQGCKNLQELDVSGFHNDLVTNMEFMFVNCESLTKLNLNGFTTPVVTSMRCMFQECRNLTQIELGSFDTSQVENMTGMFQSCQQLKALDVSGFHTEKVSGMAYMFKNCAGLTKLDLTGFSKDSLESDEEMFAGCPAEIIGWD